MDQDTQGDWNQGGVTCHSSLRSGSPVTTWRETKVSLHGLLSFSARLRGPGTRGSSPRVDVIAIYFLARAALSSARALPVGRVSQLRRDTPAPIRGARNHPAQVPHDRPHPEH